MRIVRGRVYQDGRSMLWRDVRVRDRDRSFAWADVYHDVEKVIASRVGVVCRHVSGEVL